jgi:hypothetical protein
VNAWSVGELFERYGRTRFLYPAKLSQLSPHLPDVAENWRRGLRAGELIHWVATYDAPDGQGWATVSSWRSTSGGWHTQHLVSTGGPVASRAVLLAGQSMHLAEAGVASLQNWFQPSNRFAAGVFGTFADKVRSDQSALISYEVFSLPLGWQAGDTPLSAVPVGQDGRTVPELAGLADTVRGPVYRAAEELDGDDLQMDAVDQLYGLVGLRRYRRLWIVEDAGDVVGAALCYRGPLGFNFSFLENRCDLLVRPGLSAWQTRAVVRSLLAAARGAYRRIGCGFIPVVVEPGTAAAVREIGATPVRGYSQSIWLNSAFEAWYDHVDGLYAQRLGPRRQS